MKEVKVISTSKNGLKAQIVVNGVTKHVRLDRKNGGFKCKQGKTYNVKVNKDG